jgi:CDP-glucose 4,6-dehydratase
MGMIASPKRDFWQDRPTFVTGATGLVGGWLVRQLVQEGADVVCLVRDWVPQSNLVLNGLIDRVKVVRGDVRDYNLVERSLGEYEIDTVLHLAAQAIVGIGNRNPTSTFETNIQGTWTLLEACRRSPLVKQIVTASSDKAYGYHSNLPYDEDTPLQGRHPYDVSKSCADLIAQAYAATFGLSVAITRCGNFYGGGDLNWNRIVPGTIRSVLKGERPVIRSDGESLREYLYVENAVSAYMTLAEALAKRPELAGQAFNFGHNQPWTVKELVETILKLCGREDLEPDTRAEATNEIPSQYLDPTRARLILGWEPKFTLHEGLALTIDWYRQLINSELPRLRRIN